jgi:arylsulfatase A-like enzyme
VSDRPNIVVVVLDTARADAFEPYGAAPGSSPTVRDVASSGAAAQNVFSAANWTLPSHASMFTGLLPRQLELGQAPGGRSGACRPYIERQRERLLPAVLNDAGYRTRGVSANLWITSWSGFATGFDSFNEVTTSRNKQVQDSSLRARAAWALEAVRATVDDGAAAAGELIDHWLATDRQEPFFWFVNLVECHSPWLPPRPFTCAGPLERLRTAKEAREHLTLMGMWGASAGTRQVPEEALERMRREYAASVRQVDAWIEQLLDRLDRSGVLERTLVVITSDHGENLGESGRLGHSFWLDDRLVRVPLVSMGPVRLGTGAVTSLTDLPRLLADAIGLRDHPWTDDRPEGVAVATADALTDPADERIKSTRKAFGLDGYAVWRMTTSSTAATDGALKLVREGDEDWLYDLEADPLEESPTHVDGRVAAEHGARFDALRKAVDAAHTVEHATRTVPAPTASGPDVPADLEDRMRLLGYL